MHSTQRPHNKPHTDKKHQFKQTFVRSSVYISRRDYDGMWEIVQKLPYFPWNFRGRGGKTITLLRWVTVGVKEHRQDALTRAKEIGDQAYARKNT